MSGFLSHALVPIAIGAVAVVLLLGLVNMMRGGSPQHLAEADAAARAAAVRRHRRHHDHDLGHGALGASEQRMVVLNKIYTRTGDDGTTALGTGERRKKYDLRIAAYGTLDEANAVIGIARLHTAERRRARRGAGAHPERPVRRRRRPLHAARQGQGAGRRAAYGHRRAGRLARGRDRPAQCRARAAAILHPAGRQRGRRLSASRPHRLPARRAADRRAQRQAGRERHAGSAEIRQPAVRFPVRRRPSRQRQGRARRAVEAGPEPLNKEPGITGGGIYGPARQQGRHRHWRGERHRPRQRDPVRARRRTAGDRRSECGGIGGDGEAHRQGRRQCASDDRRHRPRRGRQGFRRPRPRQLRRARRHLCQRRGQRRSCAAVRADGRAMAADPADQSHRPVPGDQARRRAHGQTGPRLDRAHRLGRRLAGECRRLAATAPARPAS